MGDISIDTDEIQRIIKIQFKDLCLTKLKNLKEINGFLYIGDLPKLNHTEINTLNSLQSYMAL